MLSRVKEGKDIAVIGHIYVHMHNATLSNVNFKYLVDVELTWCKVNVVTGWVNA